jgi:hypothetical protein
VLAPERQPKRSRDRLRRFGDPLDNPLGEVVPAPRRAEREREQVGRLEVDRVEIAALSRLDESAT